MYRAGTLGCALNHYIACKQLLADDCDGHAIFEDNAEITSNFKEGLKETLEKMAKVEWDIIHLYSNLTHARAELMPGIRFEENEWETTKAYLISKRYARTMTERIPFHEVSDGISMIPSLQWMRSGLKSFITDPMLAFKSTKLESTRTGTDSSGSKEIRDIMTIKPIPNPRFATIGERIHSNSSARNQRHPGRRLTDHPGNASIRGIAKRHYRHPSNNSAARQIHIPRM